MTSAASASQPMLPLWEPESLIMPAPAAPLEAPAPRSAPQTASAPQPAGHEASGHEQRLVARSSDRFAWLRHRAMGVTATDVARLTSPNALAGVARDKRFGSRFSGNAYTDHGRAREPEIARWVQQEYGIVPSDGLYHAEGQRSHLATPDGLAVRDGALVLAEIKTTTSEWRSIPRNYLRQVWWQQYVLGAERTLVVWERHEDFVPVYTEPQCRWVDRDDNEIHRLVQLADQLLELMRE